MWKSIAPALLVVLAATSAPAAEYGVSHGYESDLQTSGSAHIEGNSGGGVVWDLTAGPGWLNIDHAFYSCCNSDVRPSAYSQCDDLVFSSGTQAGGTATVRLRISAQGAASGCTANTARFTATVNGGFVDFGSWHSCDPSCNCSSQSNGVFSGMGGSSMSGSFLSGPVQVPLDTPVSLLLSMQTRIGSYQAQGFMDATMSLSSVEAVFELVDGPADLTANSQEAGIVDNQWVDPNAVAVGPLQPMRGPWVEAAPNPFNPRTTLRFSLPVAGMTSLELVDLRGRVVRDLGRAHYEAGEHRLLLDAYDDAGSALPSGAYLLRLRSPAGNAGTKLLLLK